jgi:hypothetical protein
MSMNDEAEALVGKYVRFAHLSESKASPVRVVRATDKGMIVLEGWVGEFAPHLFVVVDGPKEAA